ncbi:hypothetical protein EV1_015154 [Malus domestica]
MQTMVKKYQQRFRKVRDKMDSWAMLQSPGPAPTSDGEEHKMTLRAGPPSKPDSWFSYEEIPELCSTLPALDLCYFMSQKFMSSEIVHDVIFVVSDGLTVPFALVGGLSGADRDQNLQLHRRGHNLPWKLRQRLGKEVKKRVYVCLEASCVHHDPSRALGDLTRIKKHFCKKHGEKKWKCDKCSKKYAVQSDWKAHSKICGTRESFDHMLGWMKKINPEINDVDGSEANPLNPTSYSILHLVDDLVGLIDHFGGQQAFVVGHGHEALGKENGDNQKKAKANLCR